MTEWDDVERIREELEKRFPADVVDQIFSQMSSKRCLACEGIINYHTCDAAKRHLEMVSDAYQSKLVKKKDSSAIYYLVLASSVLTLAVNLWFYLKWS